MDIMEQIEVIKLYIETLGEVSPSYITSLDIQFDYMFYLIADFIHCIDLV